MVKHITFEKELEKIEKNFKEVKRILELHTDTLSITTNNEKQLIKNMDMLKKDIEKLWKTVRTLAKHDVDLIANDNKMLDLIGVDATKKSREKHNYIG